MARLLPDFPDFDSFEGYILLPVVADSEIHLLPLAEVELELVQSLLEDRLLALLQPLALLLLPYPHPHLALLVVDVRPQVLLVVGRVVLPYIDVAPGRAGDRQFQLGIVAPFVPELMSYVSIVFLKSVDDQPREDEALCEGQLGGQVRLAHISDLYASLFDGEDPVGLVLTQNTVAFVVLNALKGDDVVSFEGSVDDDEEGPKVFVEVVDGGRGPSQELEYVEHALFPDHGQVEIGAVYFSDCLLEEGGPDLNGPFLGLPAVQEEHLLPPSNGLDGHVVVDDDKPPDSVLAEVEVVNSLFIDSLPPENRQDNSWVLSQNCQSRVQVGVRVFTQ